MQQYHVRLWALKVEVFLKKSPHQLTTYTVTDFPVLGIVTLPCKYKAYKMNFEFYIVRTNKVPILDLQIWTDFNVITILLHIHSKGRMSNQSTLNDHHEVFKRLNVR